MKIPCAQVHCIFGTFCLCALIHVFLLFQETQGKSLEEMDDVFNNESIWAFKVKPTQSRFAADVETAKQELGKAGEQPMSKRTNLLLHQKPWECEKALDFVLWRIEPRNISILNFLWIQESPWTGILPLNYDPQGVGQPRVHTYQRKTRFSHSTHRT
jgi:hypothetical protein